MNIVYDFCAALGAISILLALCLLWRYIWWESNRGLNNYYEDYAGFHEVRYTFWWGFVRETHTIWDWEDWKEANSRNQREREYFDRVESTAFDHRQYPYWPNCTVKVPIPGDWDYEGPDGTPATSDEPQES